MPISKLERLGKLDQLPELCQQRIYFFCWQSQIDMVNKQYLDIYILNNKDILCSQSIFPAANWRNLCEYSCSDSIFLLNDEPINCYLPKKYFYSSGKIHPSGFKHVNR